MKSVNPLTESKKYKRVIPRDLFNEAKLLKCIGRLMIVTGEDPTAPKLAFKHDGKPFSIRFSDEGALTVINLTVTLNGQPLTLKTDYNGRGNYPLFCQHETKGEGLVNYDVLDEDGNVTDDFKELCTEIVKDTSKTIKEAIFNYIDCIRLPRDVVYSIACSGPNDQAVADALQLPEVAAELAKIDPAALIKELRQHGTWIEEELKDHAANLERILWIAAWDILEQK